MDACAFKHILTMLITKNAMLSKTENNDMFTAVGISLWDLKPWKTFKDFQETAVFHFADSFLYN